MSSFIRSITHHSPRVHRASVGLVILASLAAFALRAGAQAPSVSALSGTGGSVTRADATMAAALPVTR
jgi:hypothetical protein